MYANCTPVAACLPIGPRQWPPDAGPREPIAVEPDPDPDAGTIANACPAPVAHAARHHRRGRRPRYRTYITAAGVVRELEPTPAEPSADAPAPAAVERPRRPLSEWREELDWEGGR